MDLEIEGAGIPRFGCHRVCWLRRIGFRFGIWVGAVGIDHSRV